VELRQHFGWSQRELSRRTGISPDRLSKLEHGVRPARFEEVLALQRAFGVSFDDLLPGKPAEVSVPRPARPESPEWVGLCLIAAGQKLLEGREQTSASLRKPGAAL
jgi:transcriptional regulator with XRE-family HTH domain